MRMVVQKVERASVSVDGILRAEIGNGLMALVGLLPQDDDKVIDYMLDNLSVKDVGGDILLVPNFTLYGDARKGRRPSYFNAASPEEAEKIFNRLMEKAGQLPLKVESGVFRTHMKVELVNDGPVTILLDSDKLF